MAATSLAELISRFLLYWGHHLFHWHPYYWEILGLCVIGCALRFGNTWLGRTEKLGACFAGRKRLSIITIFILTILLRLSLLDVFPVNPPGVHDEFSYLLAADTFAHGRLTNPPHPMWVFLDTFHVLQQPTYASMYPPAQGAVLAFGQLLGSPWSGVLFSTAAMCAAVLWMLQGWLPAEWALLGALLVFVRYGILSYWMNSYWGGAVAAFGGALVMGALPRIMRNQRPLDALLLGLGMGILANSRPFEGLVLCIPVAIVLCAWLIGRCNRSWRISMPRVVLPIAAVLIITAAFDTYYNWRVTGNPFLLPHRLDDQIRNTGNFVWQKERPALHYLNPQFDASYNGSERNQFPRTWKDLERSSRQKATIFLGFFLGRALLLPLIALPWVLRDCRMRLLVWQLIMSFLGTLTVVAFFPHYAAPVTATLIAILVQALRHLRRWKWRGRAIGIALTRAVVLYTLATIPICVTQTLRHGSSCYARVRKSVSDRARISAQLESVPGQKLVIVRYGDKHAANDEWIWNRADIDRANVVWAREIPGMDTRPLLEYFRGRSVWLVEPDVYSVRLTLCSEDPPDGMPTAVLERGRLAVEQKCQITTEKATEVLTSQASAVVLRADVVTHRDRVIQEALKIVLEQNPSRSKSKTEHGDESLQGLAR